jgi:hypothetical protein
VAGVESWNPASLYGCATDPFSGPCVRAESTYCRPQQGQWHALLALPHARSPISDAFPEIPEGGLEPPRVLPQWILNPSRLPIPPLRRGGHDGSPPRHPRHRRQAWCADGREKKAARRPDVPERFARRADTSARNNSQSGPIRKRPFGVRTHTKPALALGPLSSALMAFPAARCLIPVASLGRCPWRIPQMHTTNQSPDAKARRCSEAARPRLPESMHAVPPSRRLPT